MPFSNRALTLADLPPAPPGKSGWLWTQQRSPVQQMTHDAALPRVSIVTPSYNYGQFIEETIRSVLLQDYPNFEYIIIDGNSTDNTVEVIQKYENYLSYWISEPDDGQTSAINKGYQRCTGALFAWLNADDAYIDSTCLRRVVEIYQQNYQLIVGECLNVDENDHEIIICKEFNGYSRPQTFKQYLKFWSFVSLPQPAVFVDKGFADKAFPLDENLYTTMDYQFFLRVLSQEPKSIWVKQTWVKFKYHGQNKTLESVSNASLELYEIAMAEASKALNYKDKILFQISAKDYILFSSFLSGDTPPKLNLLLRLLLKRPTLIRWILFWKLFAKAAMGSDNYLTLKKVLKHGSR